MQFKELNLSQELLDAVDELGYEEMTEIQQQSIPLLLEGADVVGLSNTGTGKTAAFGIPAVESITENDRKRIAVLILCPTRELAMQAADEMRKYARFKKCVRICAVFGGASMEKQIHELKRGANIVIGTPGRVLDHMRRRTIRLDGLRCLILDEADEMLNMGFREDIETILAESPAERQTVLFSATMPPAIMAITEKYQHDPVQVKIKSAQKTVELIQQFYFEVAMGRKTDALKLLLAAYSPSSAMIFCNTKAMVDQLTEELIKSGFRAVGLHGDMKQTQRTQVMNGFKNKATEILVATDVAARGIDVNDVDAVFNYDLPQDNEYYIHRIGRTGRAGKKGAAYTIISGRRQLFELKAIEKYTRAEIRQLPMPTKDEITAMKMESIADDISASEAIHQAYTVIDRLASQGIDSREAAARVISSMIKNAVDNLPEFRNPAPLRQGKRKNGKTVRVDINIGRNKRIAPNFILGALTDATGMSGRDFGKIDIYDNHTTVEIPESESDYIIDSANPMKVNGHPVEVRLLKEGYSNNDISRRPNSGSKPKFDRRKSAYGERKRKDVFTDYIPNRKKRTKKRH